MSDEQGYSVSKHFLNSTFRERIIEHLFIGQILKYFWIQNEVNVEVLRSEFDRGGYDLVVSKGPVSRFIQFKTSIVGGKAASVNVNLSLMDKPNGCIIWIVVDNDLNLLSYKWFGSPPDFPFPDVRSNKVARHAKGNANGLKSERPNHRKIPAKAFETVTTIEEISKKLFC